MKKIETTINANTRTYSIPLKLYLTVSKASSGYKSKTAAFIIADWSFDSLTITRGEAARQLRKMRKI